VALSSTNPLFIDSTKPIGDKVVTKVELFQILLLDGESIAIEVMNQFGFVRRYSLEAVATKTGLKYTAELWLNYQHQVKYRFLVTAAEQELYTSAIRETRAGHIISDKWEPCPNGQSFAKTQDASSLRRADFMKELTPSSTAPSTHYNAPRTLCKPSFVAEIKSLLEDLL
jgi:hypothetical protein